MKTNNFMQNIINLLNKRENINNEISRLQKTQRTISEQIKDFVNNLKKIIPNNEIESIRKTILSLNNKNEIGM